MKISKETGKDILKIVGTIIATIASVLGVQAMPLQEAEKPAREWERLGKQPPPSLIPQNILNNFSNNNDLS